MGKSRLAREVARDLPDLYPDGVWQVELAAAANPALVPGAVAAALGVAEQPGRPLLDTLAEALRDRDVLLLLDNCEHLLAACADLAEALLARCPRLRILATGRQALGLAGEVAWLVPPLAFPGHEAAPSPVALAGYEAVQLFLARARAHRPAFSLTESNAVAVATVCVRLDGIPLALELAAARLGALSVAEVAARLGDRFALLAGETRAARPRQQTLRATIDWSWDLLAETERVLLRRLAVFAGGWTLGAAEAICGDDGLSPVSRDAVLDLLSALVAKSLVQASERDGRSRYSMLETVRHYAQERLAGAGEAIRLLDSHLAWCVALAEEADRHLTGPRQADWLERLETEHDNLRAALGWASEQRAGEEGLQLAGALSRFWKLRGHLSEGRGWLERLLAGDDQCSAPVRARALNGAGTLAHRQSDYGRATELYEQALALARALGDRARIARALGNLGLVARDQSAFGRATALFEEAMALLRESGDEQGVAISLGNLGAVAFHQGAYCRATAFCEEALALNRALGDRWGIAHALGDLGLVAYQRVEYGRAEALHAESLALRREIGDKQGITYSLNHLGLVAYQLGEYGRAEALHAEALTLLRELGHRQGLAYTLNCLGSVASRQGDLVRAAALHEEALVLWREQGDHWGIATSLHSLGLLAHARGDLGQAVASHLDSLRLSRDIGAKNLLAEVLESLVWALGARGETRQAARLGGAVQALRDVLGVPLQADKLAGRERALAAMRAALGEAELATAWADGAALSPEQAVSEALPAGA